MTQPGLLRRILLTGVACVFIAPVATAQFDNSGAATPPSKAPAKPVTPKPAAPAASPANAATKAPAAPAQESSFDVASKLYEQGKQAEALVTLRKLAEAGDARAQYLVGLDLLEGKYIARDNSQGFAYLLLAAEDTAWGDLVAPRAKEARVVVEPQLSGPELIRADRIVGEFKAKRAAKK